MKDAHQCLLNAWCELTLTTVARKVPLAYRIALPFLRS
jgi:hypothetical protein